MKLAPPRTPSRHALVLAFALTVVPPPASGIPQVAVDFSFLLLPLVGLGVMITVFVVAAMIAARISSLAPRRAEVAPGAGYRGCDDAA